MAKHITGNSEIEVKTQKKYQLGTGMSRSDLSFTDVWHITEYNAVHKKT